MSTVQTSLGKGSAPLELEGFKNCLDDLANDMTIKIISTDRNKQIAKWVRDFKPDLTHRYDP